MREWGWDSAGVMMFRMLTGVILIESILTNLLKIDKS